MSRTCAAALIASLALAGSALAQEPLAIAKQGYFFVGGKYSAVGDKQVMSGQIYVEYQIPKKRTQPYPLVIVPGAAQTATNFNGTADGREGWTQHFLRRGYAVYIVEQPGRARSAYQPDTDGPQAYPQLINVQQRFTAPEKYTLWPQARHHTQWPGTGMAGDATFDVDLHSSWRADICGNLPNPQSVAPSRLAVSPIRRLSNVSVRAKIRRAADLPR